MSGIGLIAGREVKAFVRSPLLYIAAGGALLIDGAWFLVKGLGIGQSKRLSAQVLAEFFNGTTGVVMVLGVLLGMRLLAREQETGTLVLLKTSAVTDRDIVLGKFVAVMAMLALIIALTAYMPALIFVNGRVSLGHIAVGYGGVLALAAAVSAITLFASALARSQVVSAVIGAMLTTFMVLLWLIARITEAPVSDFLQSLSIHHLHQRDFMTGVLKLENVVYYGAITFFFLLAAVKTLEARRWR